MSGEAWALVAAAQCGEQEAFGELYRTHVQAVRRYVRRRVFHSELVEDVVSETFVRALGSIHTVTRQGRPVVAWLQTIAANLIRDHLRSARFACERLTDAPPDRPDTAADVEVCVIRAEDIHALRHAITSLSDLQRRCLELRYFQHLSVAETAVALARSDAAVKSITFRALRTLGTRLSKDGEPIALAA